MIFCDECYNCSKRNVIEQEHDKAKDWWAKYHVSYGFPCGAYYNPEKGYAEVHRGCR